MLAGWAVGLLAVESYVHEARHVLSTRTTFRGLLHVHVIKQQVLLSTLW